jgi:hypothetical protein
MEISSSTQLAWVPTTGKVIQPDLLAILPCESTLTQALRGDSVEIHPSICGKRYAFGQQLMSLLIRTFGNIRKSAIGSNYAVGQSLMAVIRRTP